MKDTSENRIAFLQANNAFDLFRRNFLKIGEYFESFEEFIEDTNDPDFISYAFTWNETPEGHDFWDALYHKYLNKIEKGNN